MTADSQTAPPAAQGRGAELGRLARGGVLNLVATGVTGLANLVLVVLVTRGFPPAQAGIFFAATSVFLLGARFADLGTSTGLVYFTARFRALGQEHRIPRLFRVAFTPVVAVSLAAGAVLFAFAPTWASLAVNGDPGSFEAMLRILAVFVPVAAVSEACLAATRGYGIMRPTALVEKVARPLGQLALIGVAIAVGTGHALALAWAAPYAFTALAAWAWLTRIRRRRPSTEPDPSPMTAEFWRFTAARAATGLVQVALQRLDIVLIAALRGPAEAAVYAAVTRFLVLGQMTTMALTQVVEPKLSELLGHDDRAATRTVYQTSTCWLVLLNWPFFLVFAVSAPLILRIFGSAYTAGASAAVVIAAAMLLSAACGMVGTVLNMAGRTTWNLANAVLALVVTVAVDLVLIPDHGILGAAIGFAAGKLTTNLLPLGQLAFSLRLHPLGPGARLAMVLAAVCFGALPFAVLRLAGTEPVPVAASVVAGAVLYLGLCWRFRQRLDLDALLALRRRGRR